MIEINIIEQAKKAINILTNGLDAIEEITEDRYILSLGNNDPIVIGYDKSRKILSEKDMSFSAHLKMIEQLSIFMTSDIDYLNWRNNQT